MAKTKMPKTIKVAGFTYKIRLVYDLGSTGIGGTINHITSTITLTTHQEGFERNKSSLDVLLMHEITHAIDFHYLCDALKEDEVKRLAIALQQVLHDNQLRF